MSIVVLFFNNSDAVIIFQNLTALSEIVLSSLILQKVNLLAQNDEITNYILKILNFQRVIDIVDYYHRLVSHRNRNLLPDFFNLLSKILNNQMVNF